MDVVSDCALRLYVKYLCAHLWNKNVAMTTDMEQAGGTGKGWSQAC